MREAVDKHRETIMAMSGVVGVAIGLCRDRSSACVLVYTEAGEWPEGLPHEIDGHPVEVVDTGGGFKPL